MLTASADFTAKVWDASSGKELLNLKGHTQEVTSVTFSTDGRYALTASHDGTAIVWLATQWKAADERSEGSSTIPRGLTVRARIGIQDSRVTDSHL